MRRELSEKSNSFRLLLFCRLLALSLPDWIIQVDPLKTNKAAALAKFLKRKLQGLSGLASIDPDLLELAVKNARNTVISSGASSSGRTVQHFASFEVVEVPSDDDKIVNTKLNKKKKKKKDEKKKKKNKKHKDRVNEGAKLKRPNKKLKL